MNSALPAAMMSALCLTVLMSFAVSAQSATSPAPAAPAAVSTTDSKAAAIRARHPFLGRAPRYNGIPMEYRLAAIEGPQAERIIDDYIEYGFSDFGSLLITKKDQLPAALRSEPGATCTTCTTEGRVGRRQVEYYVAWLRGLSVKQRKELKATLEK